MVRLADTVNYVTKHDMVTKFSLMQLVFKSRFIVYLQTASPLSKSNINTNVKFKFR